VIETLTRAANKANTELYKVTGRTNQALLRGLKLESSGQVETKSAIIRPHDCRPKIYIRSSKRGKPLNCTLDNPSNNRTIYDASHEYHPYKLNHPRHCCESARN